MRDADLIPANARLAPTLPGNRPGALLRRPAVLTVLSVAAIVLGTAIVLWSRLPTPPAPDTPHAAPVAGPGTSVGEGEVIRGGAGTPTAAEVVAPGTEVMSGPGEWSVEHPAAVYTAHNPGEEPATSLVTGLVATDEPLLQPMEMDMATPAP